MESPDVLITFLTFWCICYCYMFGHKNFRRRFTYLVNSDSKRFKNFSVLQITFVGAPKVIVETLVYFLLFLNICGRTQPHNL